MATKQLSSKAMSRTMSGLREIFDADTPLDEVKVFVMTWNMGNAEPEGFMNVFEEKNAKAQYDIFAIGLQESTYAVKAMPSSATGTHESIGHLQNHIKSYFPDDQFEVVSVLHSFHTVSM